MSIRVFAIASALTAALGAPALGQGNADWSRPFPAFKLIGNVYWVGTYDLSTFLSRFPVGDREWILEAYRKSLAKEGWPLPAAAVLNGLFATAECARLANRVIWPAIAVSQGDADREWAFGELASLADWLTEMQPLLALT